MRPIEGEARVVPVRGKQIRAWFGSRLEWQFVKTLAEPNSVRDFLHIILTCARGVDLVLADAWQSNGPSRL